MTISWQLQWKISWTGLFWAWACLLSPRTVQNNEWQYPVLDYPDFWQSVVVNVQRDVLNLECFYPSSCIDCQSQHRSWCPHFKTNVRLSVILGAQHASNFFIKWHVFSDRPSTLGCGGLKGPYNKAGGWYRIDCREHCQLCLMWWAGLVNAKILSHISSWCVFCAMFGGFGMISAGWCLDGASQSRTLQHLYENH